MAKFNNPGKIPTGGDSAAEAIHDYMVAFKKENNGDATFFHHKGHVVGVKTSDYDKLDKSHYWQWVGVTTPVSKKPQLYCPKCKAVVFPGSELPAGSIAAATCLKSIPMPSHLHPSHTWQAAEISPASYSCSACGDAQNWAITKPTEWCISSSKKLNSSHVFGKPSKGHIDAEQHSVLGCACGAAACQQCDYVELPKLAGTYCIALWEKDKLKKPAPSPSKWLEEPQPVKTMKMSDAVAAQTKQSPYLCDDPKCACNMNKTKEAQAKAKPDLEDNPIYQKAKAEMDAAKLKADKNMKAKAEALMAAGEALEAKEKVVFEDLDDGPDISDSGPPCECDECMPKQKPPSKKKVPFKDFFASQLKETVKPAQELVAEAEKATEAFEKFEAAAKPVDAFKPWGKDKPPGGHAYRHWFRLEKDGKQINRWVMVPLKLAMQATFEEDGWAVVGEEAVTVELPFDQYGPLPSVKPCCRGACCSPKCHKYAGSHVCDVDEPAAYTKDGKAKTSSPSPKGKKGTTFVKGVTFAPGGVITNSPDNFFVDKYGTTHQPMTKSSWAQANLLNSLKAKQAEMKKYGY